MQRKSHRDHQSLKNPQDRKARENLEQRAQKKMKWGLNQGFPVYYWQSIASGCRWRTLVSHHRAFELINEYLKSQIIFDGFRHEYEVCSEFGALDRNIDEDFDEELEPDEQENNFRRTFVEFVYVAQGTFTIYHMHFVSCPLLDFQIPEQIPELPLPAVLERDLIQAYGNFQVNKDQFRYPSHLLSDVLYKCLGLTCPTVPSEYTVSESWEKVRKFLHEWNDVLDSRWYLTVIAFVTGLLS